MTWNIIRYFVVCNVLCENDFGLFVREIYVCMCVLNILNLTVQMICCNLMIEIQMKCLGDEVNASKPQSLRRKHREYLGCFNSNKYK